MAAHLSRPTLSLRLTNLRLITLEELLEVQNVPAREVRTKREQRVERKAPKGYEIVGSRMGSGGFELLSLQISNQDPQSVSHSSRCARSGCRYRRTHPSYVCGQRFPRSELVDVIATNAPRILWFLKHVRYPECPPDRISTVVRNQQTAVAGINLGVKNADSSQDLIQWLSTPVRVVVCPRKALSTAPLGAKMAYCFSELPPLQGKSRSAREKFFDKDTQQEGSNLQSFDHFTDTLAANMLKAANHTEAA
ncbi:hypothetical protein C8F04DRAFT_1188267 [Mycena alexandri]|uniref:Uncharacterized protein n=1 Tax=Mycena alexandri TaxID=1745969 RepID=A0AAD6SIT5_9AGAR|nr:hypothetical protein C8F04DRAFT_1188267 [Mycena alexandri]